MTPSLTSPSTPESSRPTSLAGELSLSEVFTGKRVLFVGGTGFVGKVALSMLLHRYPQLEKVYILVRASVGVTAEQRFYGKLMASPAFDPLRQTHGAGLEAYLRARVEILAGDVTKPLLGIDEATYARIGRVDAIYNCAGQVSFNPPLDQALSVNTIGVLHCVEAARRLGDAALVHISTCFVAGNRSGSVFENEPVVGYFPRRGDLLSSDAQQGVGHYSGEAYSGESTAKASVLDGNDFSWERELEDCKRISERIRESANDRALASKFRADAIRRLLEDGRSPSDEKTLHVSIARERKNWIASELRRVGTERAQHWGWPNTYCYSKSLGDQIAASSGLRYALVRPAIVESALRFPFPGWNEGFTTTAPLAFMSLRGQRQYPASETLILDVIPVDFIASGSLSVLGAALAGVNDTVYHLGTSDSNPLLMSRCIELVGLSKRRYFQDRETGPAWWNAFLARTEPYPVSEARYEKTSAPMIGSLARRMSSAIDANRALWGASRYSHAVERAKDKLAQVERSTKAAEDMFTLFIPFTLKNHYVFRCDNMRALHQRLTPEDRESLPWDLEKLDWLTYWVDVHMEGLRRWVFPSLEEEFRAPTKRVYTYRDLLELLETAARQHGRRVALRRLAADGTTERFTYADVQRLATVGAERLLAQGVERGARVVLLSENRPEWAISYFAVLKAGATCVSVDPSLPAKELAEIVRSSQAAAIVYSDKTAATPGLSAALDGIESAGDHGLLRLRMSDLLAEPTASPTASASLPADKQPLVRAGRSDEIASIVFTRGTTGRPKGVQLSHHNFTSLVAKLQTTFEMGPRDGMLSVLPLHNTLELTCGLLVPLSRGAAITYLDEVTPDSLRAGLQAGRVTAMVGTPELWQLLAKSVQQELSSLGGLAQAAAEGLGRANSWLRDRSPLNLGRVLFAPVHAKVGGSWLRYLITGGDALPSDVQQSLHGWGFSLFEGYGLAESSPVLTVQRPSNRLQLGTVGEPLPGVEVKIHEPNSEGVGEIIARGPNVMVGYLDDAAATANVLRDGWLHTGDLGRLDDNGQLVLAGRKATADSGLQVDRGHASVVAAATPSNTITTLASAATTARSLLGQARGVLGSLLRTGSLSTATAVAAGVADSVGRELGRLEKLAVPPEVARAGRAIIGSTVSSIYRHGFDVKVTGRAFVPSDRPVIIAANHCSHLDIGIIRYALGEMGERAAVLAAKDYWFDGIKRPFVENFTNLVPMERRGSLKESLRLATKVLRDGRSLILFPEGTRSATGEISEFKPSLGYLVLTNQVDVLPVYVGGTFESLPRGAVLPRQRELTVRVGPVLSCVALRGLTRSMSRSGAYREASRHIEASVRALAAGEAPPELPADAGALFEVEHTGEYERPVETSGQDALPLPPSGLNAAAQGSVAG